MKLRNTHIQRWLVILAAFVAIGAAPRVVKAMTLQEEIDLGKKIDAQILKDNQLYSDEKAQKEMEAYGQKLAKGVKRPEIPYHFRILKDNEFNAFSVPGGYVYFTDHLWTVLRKDERIGVIGHEITHVDRRHAIDAMLKQQQRRIWLSVLLAATRANDIWGNVAGLAENMYTLKYSRGDEQQADEGAVNLCQKEGYNPAGILLAMYKIKRFEDESGGAPPKIFSDHPPTKERLAYLKQILINDKIPVPAEQVQDAAAPYKIGEVVSKGDNNITFTSSKQLQPGDVVWVMRDGWDYYYEKRTAVPMARGVVKSTGSTLSANITMMPVTSAKTPQIVKGSGVYAPPLPSAPSGVGTIKSLSLQSSVGKLMLNDRPRVLDRYYAMQPVWNADRTQLIYDKVGYIVITNPSNDTGYLPVSRPKYTYAPLQDNPVLERVNDPDARYWVGPVVSIGRNSQTIEVKTDRVLDSSKTYEVAYPAWSKDDIYRLRVVGTARVSSSDKKLVLRIATFTGGWAMSDIQNGFDVYEQRPTVK